MEGVPGMLSDGECGSPMLNGLDGVPPYALYAPPCDVTSLIYDSGPEGEVGLEESEDSGSQTEDAGETTTEGDRTPEPRVGYVSTFFRCGCSCCWRYQMCRMGVSAAHLHLVTPSPIPSLSSFDFLQFINAFFPSSSVPL